MSESSTGAGNATAAALVTGSSFAFKSIMAMEIIRFLRFINVLYMKTFIKFDIYIINNISNNLILDKLSS